MRLTATLVAGGAILGFIGVPLLAEAGSNLCPTNRVCIYDGHNYVGLLGSRSPGGGLQNVSGGANDKTSSFENKTAMNARWYYDANGTGRCVNMLAKRERNIEWWDSDQDKLTSWATNGSC